MRVDVVQYQAKLNISELIEAGMELSEVKIKLIIIITNKVCMALFR